MALEIERERTSHIAELTPEPAGLTAGERAHEPSRYERVARALGWFSVGLGAWQLLYPRGVTRAIGVRADPGLVRALGAREIASGVAILAQKRPAPLALHARVAGDLVDLGLMGAAWNARRTDRTRLAIGAAAVLGVTALDVVCSQKLRASRAARPIELHASVAVQRTPEELYKFWRELSNLPRVLSHVEAIETYEGGRFRVQGKRVAGRELSWDAQIIDDIPNEQFTWSSTTSAPLASRGQVSFRPLGGDRGTSLQLSLRFEPRPGTVASTLLHMLGDAPEQLLKAELRRFKQWIETGELATTEGQPSGKRSLVSRHLP